MKLFKKKNKNKEDYGRHRSPEPRQKVISYYTASRHQLDSFERQTQADGDSAITRHAKSLKHRWFQGLVLIVLLGCAVYMGSLNTKPHVTVQGTQYRTSAEYQAAVEAVYGNDIRNRIKPMLMSKQIEEAVKEAIPEASVVNVSSSLLGHQADVKIISDEPLAIFTQPNAPDLIISKQGRVLLATTENTKIQTANLPILENLTGVEARAGEQFMRPDETISFGRLIAQYAAENSKPIFSLSTIPHELSAKEVGRGTYQVRYILDETIVSQFGALRATEKKLQELSQKPAEYIDVRLADKAYIK